VPFSSAERWSAIAAGDTMWVLGAPDVLLGWSAPEHRAAADEAAQRVMGHVQSGRRVLLLASMPAHHEDQRPDGRLQPLAVVVLGENVRADVPDTAAWFAAQGVTLKVLSGDEPVTIGAVATAVGIEGGDAPVDARAMAHDPDSLARAVERS